MNYLVALHDLNSQTDEHRAHRRIDVLIRASDLMTTRLQHPCERSHRCPANPDQVVVHESIKYTLFAISTLLRLAKERRGEVLIHTRFSRVIGSVRRRGNRLNGFG